jgi:hypothetical protein
MPGGHRSFSKKTKPRPFGRAARRTSMAKAAEDQQKELEQIALAEAVFREERKAPAGRPSNVFVKRMRQLKRKEREDRRAADHQAEASPSSAASSSAAALASAASHQVMRVCLCVRVLHLPRLCVCVCVFSPALLLPRRLRW